MRTFKVGSALEHMISSMDERRIHVAYVRPGQVSVIDTRRRDVVKAFDLWPSLHGNRRGVGGMPYAS